VRERAAAIPLAVISGMPVDKAEAQMGMAKRRWLSASVWRMIDGIVPQS